MGCSTDVTHEDELTCLNEYSDCQNSFFFLRISVGLKLSEVLKYGLIL